MPAKTGSFRLVSSKTQEFDRAGAARAAERHAALGRSPTERELDPKHTAELVKRIKGGLMIPFNWATVDYAGSTYRMNGQHSSSAILECGDAIAGKVIVHFDHYEADSPAAMAELFRQFDSRISSRSRQDVSGAYQGLVAELDSVNRKHAKLGVEGIGWYQRSIEKLPVKSGDDLYDMLLQPTYHPFLRWLGRILTVKTPELEKAPIVGAMYATFNSSESGANEFWPQVALGNSKITDDHDPRAVLSKELVDIKTEKRALAPAEYYAKCVKAWNAFRAGDKIRSLSVSPKKGLPDIAA